MKTYTLEELKNKLIGSTNSESRLEYEKQLALHMLTEISFWEQLKELMTENEYYFCHACEGFRLMWDNIPECKNEIRNLAGEFLENEDTGAILNKKGPLFNVVPIWDYETENKIRVQFCDYMINKLK